MVRIAALDLGTNTFRLMVADIQEGGRPKPLLKEQVITRLGGGFDNSRKELSGEALERARRALEYFARSVEGQKPDGIYARATDIVRRAANGGEFLDMASRILGTEVETLCAGEEARLALKGILAYNPPIGGPFVTLDVGGGSTELTLVEGNTLQGWTSTGLGVVDLSERLLSDSDPPPDTSIARCEKEVGNCLRQARAALGSPEYIEAVVGTGGTATSLAVMDLGLGEYDERAVQNHRLSLEKIRELESRLTSMTFRQRADIFPLGGGREDVIIPGTIITRMTLETFGTGKMLVSEAGLLEGVALAGADNIRKEVKEE